MTTVALHTLGCRLNQAETAIIAQSFKNRGFEIVNFGEKADITIINTCTVTQQADAKCRQAVRQSLRKNPDSFVAVIGCYAQVALDDIRQIKGVDLIMGNEDKLHVADHIDGMQKRSEPLILHSPKIERKPFTIDTPALYTSHTRANLKIQDGCSFVCSFCIIVKARGPARSRDFDDLLREAKILAQRGFKEIVLTGVNIGTYRFDNKNFLDVLQALEAIPGIERIRISSIEPTTVSKQLIDFMADSQKVCPYLHIPLQKKYGGSAFQRVCAALLTTAFFIFFAASTGARLITADSWFFPAVRGEIFCIIRYPVNPHHFSEIIESLFRVLEKLQPAGA